jgi:hypothetical protein
MRGSEDLEEKIHAVRHALYEETKNMPTSEKLAYIKAQVAPVEMEFGIKAEYVPVPSKREPKVASTG